MFIKLPALRESAVSVMLGALMRYQPHCMWLLSLTPPVRRQVPLRPVRVPAVKPPPGPTSPISQKMDTMCSTTRVQMLTPRNRRAVCLLSQSSLPAAGQAAPPSPVKMAPLSPVQMAPLDSSPSAPKRRRGEAAALSSPFQQYLLQRDMLTSEPVDLSMTEVTSPPPAPPPPPAATVTGESTTSYLCSQYQPVWTAVA